jgi:hypothetical protein
VMYKYRPAYIPTPIEIALACEAIRAEWTAAEQRRRAEGLSDETHRASSIVRRRNSHLPSFQHAPDVTAVVEAR